MGIPSPKVLVSKAKELLFEALALTDSSNVCGVVEAVEAAEKEGVKLIIGAEIWTIDGPENEKEPAPGAQLVLLVKSDAGWRNLCQILTIAHRQRSFSPRIRLEQLKEHREGLHVLTGGQWGIFQEEKRCEERLMALVDAVGPGSIDVEVVDHGKEGDATRNERAASFAERLSLPVVATNDSRYLQTTDIGILEGLVKVGVGENPALVDMVCGTDQATLKTEAEMRELWPEKWIERSGQIAEMCSFKLPRGKPMLPRVEDHETLESITNRFPPPRGFPEAPRQIEGDKRPVDKYFRWLCTEGLKMRLREEPEAIRFATEEEYFKQLEFECGVIEGMEYVVYHLIVSEFTNWAKDNKIAVGPGRGSAAGSVAVWALRITDVNPRQFGLFFERFLNPERRGLPDIDMDFEQERREEVIAHVREKYGEECVGQILTIGKMKAKGALKDAARVCRAHFDESNYWSMFIDNGPKAKLKDSLGQGYLRALKEGSPLFHRVSDLALAFEGKPRQQGVHAAGVIIASDPVSRFCPMHYMPADQISCTGLDMDAAEKVGLVKFDFLGLKTLDVIRIASAMVREKTGSEPKIVDPLFDDPAVFELMRSGETEGLFQIESGGMNRLIRRLVPNNFEEVICLLALYRPGPLKAGMVNSWIERKHGREVVESVHPLLDEVLGPTYGLIVYQEQALSTARVLAGFSLGQADLLRRAIGKKKADEMAQQRSSFVKGCWETNRIDEKEATRVFNLIDYFSGYSFNKCIDISTPVITGRGVIRADEVVVGDEVMEFNRGKIQRGNVRRVWPIERKERIQIWFDDGSAVICSEEHRFIDFDTGEEIEAFRATSERRRLAGIVRTDPVNTDKKNKAHFEMRSLQEQEKGNPCSDNVKSVEGTRRFHAGEGVRNREENICSTGCSERQSRASTCLEKSRAGEVQTGMHQQNAKGKNFRRNDVQCVKNGERDFAHSSFIQEECTSEDERNREASGFCRIVHGRSGWTSSLQADLRRGETSGNPSEGQAPGFMGHEKWKDPGEDLYRLFHQLRSAETNLEGEDRGDSQDAEGWSVSPRKPIRIDRLPVGPVVDIEVGGDHLYVLGNGLISHNSHSASYAIITYMTAKLKAHHQTEFMAASMTLDMGDKDRIRQYAGALRRTGIKLLRPDINRSRVGFSAEEDSVRFGLGAIRGLGNAVIPGLISNRPYSSVEDLIERAKVSMPVAEALVWSGAMDSVEKDRFNTWWKLKRPRRKALPKKIAAEQVLLFGGGRTVGEVKDEEDLAAEDQVKPSRLTEIEIFGKEANFLGVSLGVHPLERFDDVRKKVQTHSILGLRAVGPEKTPFIIVARIDDIEKEEDRRGDSVAFVTLEDTEASIRVVLRGQVLKKIDQETTLVVGNCIAVHGTASAFEDNDPIVVVEQIDMMSEFRWRTGRSVEIEIRSTDLPLLDQIRKILDSNTEKATHEVFVKIIGGDKTSWAKLDRKVQPSQVMLDTLERLTGRPDVVHVPTAEK
jgi:DNA-directed DNA polymerase III PolC